MKSHNKDFQMTVWGSPDDEFPNSFQAINYREWCKANIEVARKRGKIWRIDEDSRGDIAVMAVTD